jgi:coenzyme PQQ precursor peptide PqqA
MSEYGPDHCRRPARIAAVDASFWRFFLAALAGWLDRHYEINTNRRDFSVVVRAAHTYNGQDHGVRPTPGRQKTRIGGRVDAFALRYAPMTWTKPEFEIVAVTMEVTAYAATR